MDDTKFRNAILADPNSQSDEIKEAIANDPSKQAYVAEMHEFDALIEEAMHIDVPDDLESKLLLHQHVQNDVKPTVNTQVPTKATPANDSRYWQIAAAACFAFVIGLSLNLSILRTDSGMGAGEYALKNTYSGIQNANLLDQQVPLTQVNAQLASYGVQMEQEIGAVTYANAFFCGYNKVNVLHLIVEGKAGKISLFVLPKDNRLDNWKAFSDERFNGKAARYSNADMVIVGEKEEPLRAFQSKIENSMKWKT